MAFTVPDIAGLEDHIISEVWSRIRQRTPVDTGRARAGWEISGNTITNEVPYVGFLEHGTDRMAPFGMVATTLEEVPSIIEDYLSSH
jgi:hypothetical protein